MTDVVARIGTRVDAIGGKWMGQPVMAAGAALGFTGYPWPFSMVGRGGVLGDVDPDVLASAMVFPSPALVRSAWAQGRAVLTPDEGVARFIGCGYDWAPTVFHSAHDLARSVELLEKLADAVEVSDAPLASGWRAVPLPSSAAERVVRAIQVLREHRGGVHATCDSYDATPTARVVTDTTHSASPQSCSSSADSSTGATAGARVEPYPLGS